MACEPHKESTLEDRDNKEKDLETAPMPDSTSVEPFSRCGLNNTCLLPTVLAHSGDRGGGGVIWTTCPSQDVINNNMGYILP
jgi:hypothetical protein